ncbi:tyrosine-type recombinase/integrase [Akkermansiaceae bacterium]|nr:tyrosine-type recombinase/integrase [Akkermansiaceae bacterium]
MATVFRNDNSPYWKARYLNAQGKRVSRSTKTKSKREAKKIAEQFEAGEKTNKNESLGLSVAYGKILQRVIREAEAGKLGLAEAQSYVREIHKIANPEFEETSLDSFWNKWINEQEPHVSSSTFKGYRQDYELLSKSFGRGQVTGNISVLLTEHVEKAVHKAHKSGRKAATVNKALGSLRRVMESALTRGLITKNPAKAVRSLKEADSSIRAPFSLKEVNRILQLQDISKEWRGAIILAAHSGLRCGDVVRLCSDDIKDGVATIMPEKTSRMQRVIRIPLSEDFLAWLEGREGEIFPTLSKQKKGTTSSQFLRLMEKAGVARTVKGVGRMECSRSFHCLRHSFTSWLADAGVPEEVRQNLTGHSSSRIHQNYTHFDSAPVEAIKKLPSLKSEK